jgi:hypothetical protein
VEAGTLLVDNIVAVAVELEDGSERFFLTWGRIQDAVDFSKLEELVLQASGGFSLGGKPRDSRLCHTLQEASNEPYFYECFFEMCQTQIPFGEKTYEPWRKEINAEMQKGKQPWYLGEPA